MKALTFHEPWGSLVALNEKQIETRSWLTNQRGQIFIHTAQTFPEYARPYLKNAYFYDALKAHNLTEPKDFNLGAIIAVAEIVDCVKTEEIVAKMKTAHKNGVAEINYGLNFIVNDWLKEYTFGNYDNNRFCYLFSNVRRLEMPVKCKGFQRFWNVPDNVTESVLAQL